MKNQNENELTQMLLLLELLLLLLLCQFHFHSHFSFSFFISHFSFAFFISILIFSFIFATDGSKARTCADCGEHEYQCSGDCGWYASARECMEKDCVPPALPDGACPRGSWTTTSIHSTRSILKGNLTLKTIFFDLKSILQK